MWKRISEGKSRERRKELEKKNEGKNLNKTGKKIGRNIFISKSKQADETNWKEREIGKKEEWVVINSSSNFIIIIILLLCFKFCSGQEDTQEEYWGQI